MHGPLLHATQMACYSGPHEAWSRSLANDGRSLVPKASAQRLPEADCAPSCASASSTLSTVMSQGTGMLHLTSNVSADRRPPGAVIVSSAAGGIQFEKQRRGVLIDLTSHRFDLEVFPPSEHTCTTVTRSEAHHLTVALATLLGG